MVDKMNRMGGKRGLEVRGKGGWSWGVGREGIVCSSGKKSSEQMRYQLERIHWGGGTGLSVVLVKLSSSVLMM